MGLLVLQVLESKHPELREPPAVEEADGTFEPYAAVPTDVLVDITADVVETVASKLTNVAGPGGTEAIDLHNWLLRFGSES